MRKSITLVVILGLSLVLVPVAVHAVGVNWVDGYYRTDGTWVEGHYRTEPNDYESDNLGSDGIDMDNDGYGAGTVNDLYDHNNNDVYDGYEYGSYNYDSYNYDTGYGSYDSYDYGGYDSYDLSW